MELFHNFALSKAEAFALSGQIWLLATTRKNAKIANQ
jgi:hypothetical protein